MVLVNYSTRELSAKVVFYGPGLCGKTTNLQYIFDNLLPESGRSKMVSLATETDRTLFFDFLPLDIGKIRGLETRLQLYTVPGQVHYNATRKIVLKGADGIVFVADSQRAMREKNLESYANMKENLEAHGMSLNDIPLVLQLNKRDLPEIMTVEEMEEDLNELNGPFWEAIAIEGIGVEDTLKSVSRQVLKKLAQRFEPGAVEGLEEPAARPALPSPAATVASVPEVAPTPPHPPAPPPMHPPAPPPMPPAGLPAPPSVPDFAATAIADEPGGPPLLAPSGEMLALGADTPRVDEDVLDEELLEVSDDALLLDDPMAAAPPPEVPTELPASEDLPPIPGGASAGFEPELRSSRGGGLADLADDDDEASLLADELALPDPEIDLSHAGEGLSALSDDLLSAEPAFGAPEPAAPDASLREPPAAPASPLGDVPADLLGASPEDDDPFGMQEDDPLDSSPSGKDDDEVDVLGSDASPFGDEGGDGDGAGPGDGEGGRDEAGGSQDFGLGDGDGDDDDDGDAADELRALAVEADLSMSEDSLPSGYPKEPSDDSLADSLAVAEELAFDPLATDDELAPPDLESPQVTASQVTAPQADGDLEVPVTIDLGSVAPGGDVQRTLRIPVEYADSTGARQSRTLEVKLSFKLD